MKTVDELMALADRYAFHIPGSQHSDEARAVLLAALQEQAREGEAVAIKDAVGCVLEGWTLPEPVRKILETAYYAAPQPAQPESIECDCGRIHKKTRYGWACSEPAQPVAQPLTDEDCTRIYNEANNITVKNPPISTSRIFAAMRAAHIHGSTT